MTESLELPRRGTETIIIDSLLVNYKLTTCYNLFAGFRNLKRIIGLEYLNTSKVVNMTRMFILCSSLISLDLRGFDTSKVIDMHEMFNGCYALTNLDLSNFDTSNVTDMEGMFASCEKLTSLNLSRFNTSKVIRMNEMFHECKNLKTIYVRAGFNTNNLKDSLDMFNYCFNLVGEKGTKYNPKVVDKTFAKIDGGKDNPGYFTYNYKKL
jgi:surface protein